MPNRRSLIPVLHPVHDFIPAAAGIFHSGMEIRTLYATFAADFKGNFSTYISTFLQWQVN